jgi:hypothetical protein
MHFHIFPFLTKLITLLNSPTSAQSPISALLKANTLTMAQAAEDAGMILHLHRVSRVSVFHVALLVRRGTSLSAVKLGCNHFL